jgi:hypothetical protein
MSFLKRHTAAGVGILAGEIRIKALKSLVGKIRNYT